MKTQSVLRSRRDVLFAACMIMLTRCCDKMKERGNLALKMRRRRRNLPALKSASAKTQMKCRKEIRKRKRSWIVEKAIVMDNDVRSRIALQYCSALGPVLFERLA